jgi:predicted NUDIX family NTP pyrophosphohydrolase
MSRNKVSAGLLMYRIRNGKIEVFLAHPGGPLFRNRDVGHWTIPKGEVQTDEELLDTAKREFFEEVGIRADGSFVPLGSIRQRGGKTVFAWAFAGDCHSSHNHVCNDFTMEWPPHSGQYQNYPELDRVGFFSLDEAREKLKETQRPFLDRLIEGLEKRGGQAATLERDRTGGSS